MHVNKIGNFLAAQTDQHLPLLPSSIIPMMATVRFREFGLYLLKVVITGRKLNKFSLTELGWDKL